MPFSTFLACLALMSTTGWAQYVLEDDYTGNGNFFDKFSFWNSSDPTSGFVDYVDRDYAQQAGLIGTSSGQVTMGVDHNGVTPNGRPSVRLTSNKSYDSGLVILDLEHMPGGICGTWPAFWMVGPKWPSQGEIDIIEGVNDQVANAMTLHTGPGCSISDNGGHSGSVVTNNCDINAAGQGKNQGCQIATTDTRTYGTGFNANKGGVYAVDWTASAISIYFFARGSIPSDISNGWPQPSGWDNPVAKFQGGCDIASTFTNQQIVFDTTFCGDWAGATWSISSCAAKASTCNAYVENNPSDFASAYWAVNSLKVYKNNGATSRVALSDGASSSTAASTAVSSTESAFVHASSSSLISATTFAVPTKPSVVAPVTSVPDTPLAPNAISTYPAGNATNRTFPNGTATGSAPMILSARTGAPSGFVGGSSFISLSAPASVSAGAGRSSPPEVAPPVPTTTSLADAGITAPAAAQQATGAWDWQSRESEVPNGRHHHYGPPSVKERYVRHFRQHKRHGSGRL